MGEVLTTMKIMPDSPDVDLEGIKSAIESSMPEGAKLHEMSEEPIAFGLVAVILQFITPFSLTIFVIALVSTCFDINHPLFFAVTFLSISLFLISSDLGCGT